MGAGVAVADEGVGSGDVTGAEQDAFTWGFVSGCATGVLLGFTVAATYLAVAIEQVRRRHDAEYSRERESTS